MRFAIALAIGIGLIFSAPLYAGATSHENEAQEEAPEVSAPPQPEEGDMAPAEGEEAPAEGEEKAEEVEEAEPDPN